LKNLLSSIYPSPMLFDLIFMTIQLSEGSRTATEQWIHPFSM